LLVLALLAGTACGSALSDFRDDDIAALARRAARAMVRTFGAR
jgi:hypothetical protein